MHILSASLFVGILALSSEVVSQDGLPQRAPKEALLFKSGQSYLYREADLKGDEKSVRLRLPRGIHGTIWLESDSATIKSTRSKTIDTTEEVEVRSLVDSLMMAVGSSVVLDCKSGVEIRSLQGRLVRALRSPVQGSVPSSETSTPSAVVLDMGEGVGGGMRVLPLSRIVGVALMDRSPKWTYKALRKTPVLEAELDSSAGRPGHLGLSYMAEGLAWAPSYALTLGADGAAQLRGKAVIMNDLEDFVDTHVRLVVGYPNIKFARVQSSLIPDVTIAMFRQMLGSASSAVSVMGQQVMFNDQQIMSNFAPPSQGGIGGGMGQSVIGESAEDLFIYDLGKVSLRRGERAYRPFLDQKVSFAHRYDLKIGDRIDNRGYYQSAEDKPLTLWHVLRLKNKSSEPWTTAPILIAGDKGPLAQSQINYTPPGTEAVVRLTKALNIVAETVEYRSDAEKSQRRTRRLFGNNYEEIVVKCEVRVSNRGASSAPVRITKELSGDLIESDGEPKVTGRAKSFGRVNAARSLRWDFDLPAGGAWKAEYSYRVFIRR